MSLKPFLRHLALAPKPRYVSYTGVSGKAIWTMMTIKYRDWELTTDNELTKSTYDSVLIGSSNSCNCDECKNFSDNVTMDKVYPEEIKRLFGDLGIDYRKENEVSHFGRQEDGLHYYLGWFHFKGHFKGKDCKISVQGGGYNLDLTPITDKFSIGFRVESSLTFFKDGKDLVQVEFGVRLPWTIDKQLETT